MHFYNWVIFMFFWKSLFRSKLLSFQRTEATFPLAASLGMHATWRSLIYVSSKVALPMDGSGGKDLVFARPYHPSTPKPLKLTQWTRRAWYSDAASRGFPSLLACSGLVSQLFTQKLPRGTLHKSIGTCFLSVSQMHALSAFVWLDEKNFSIQLKIFIWDL